MSAPTALPLAFGPATLDDLMRVDGKAELVAGKIVRYISSGFSPSRVALKIAFKLELYSDEGHAGYAFGDGMGFAQHPPLRNGRRSFSPDASYHFGSPPANEMRFIKGSPIFAVEVRSENDYGPRAKAEMEAKRADYFEAGTLVVWDVDPVARTILNYRGNPIVPVAIYRLGDTADAEPALPGWRLVMADLFR